MKDKKGENMFIDIVQTLVFLFGLALDKNVWFQGFEVYVLPIGLALILISWISALKNNGSNTGATAMGIIEVITYSLWLLDWWNRQYYIVSLPDIIQTAINWLIPIIILTVNLSQEISIVLSKIPQKVTRM